MKRSRSAWLFAAMLAAAAGLLVLGAFNGGAQTVFAKAARVCLECIGVG